MTHNNRQFLATYVHSGHSIIVCRTCDGVIQQCRCMDHNKPRVVAPDPCDGCLGAGFTTS